MSGMNSKMKWFLTTLFLFGPSLVYANDNVIEDALQKGLFSEKMMVRQLAEKNIQEARHETIKRLLEIAKKKEDKPQMNGAKELAINLLGDYRAVEVKESLDVVNFLIEEISFQPPGLGLDLSAIGSFPCARALVKIGNPAIRGIFGRMGSRSVSEKELKIYAWIIRSIDGDNLGQVRLEQNLETNLPPTTKKRFEDLLEIYKAKKVDY